MGSESKRTGSALDLGLIGLAQFLPALGLVLVVGHAADRYDRRQIARISQATQAGPAAVYASCAVLFVIASVLIGWIRLARVPLKHELASLKFVFAGLTFIRSRPAVLGAISLDLFAVLLGGATALLPIFARDILDTGPWGLGLLRSVIALGALCMAAYLARHPLQRRAGRVMFAAVTMFGIATVAFGLSRSFALSFAALIALGASDMISVVIRSSLVQIATPDGMRGRVSAVNAMFIGTSNQLGEFESGLIAAWFGTVPAVVLGSHCRDETAPDRMGRSDAALQGDRP